MLALIVAVELTVARQGPALMDPIGYSWAFSERAARLEAPGRELLCLGDSLAKHGLIPRVLEQGTRRPAYNLAAPASPSPVTYHLLRRALDAGARPAAVVFDFEPGLLVGGPRFAVKQWPRVLTLWETLGLIRTARGGGFAAELLLTTVLPSLNARHEVRGRIVEALRGDPPKAAELNAMMGRNWTINDGGHLATPRPSFTGEVSEAEHRQHLSHGFHAHRVNALYARRLLDLAAEQDIRAYLVIPPSTPQLQQRREQTGARAKYDAFLRSLQKRSPGLTVLDARGSGYPPSVFVDPIHLDARGGAALSAVVAEVVRRDLDGGHAPPGRWVRLSAYRPTPVPEGLKDF
jgi:hypothetical protein